MAVQAKFLYKAVGDQLGWKKRDGSDMEPWESLPATEQNAFQAAADYANRVRQATLPDVPPDTGKKPGG